MDGRVLRARERCGIFTVVTDDNSASPAQGFVIDGPNALDPTSIEPSVWKLNGVFCFTDRPSAATPKEKRSNKTKVNVVFTPGGGSGSTISKLETAVGRCAALSRPTKARRPGGAGSSKEPSSKAAEAFANQKRK